MNDDDERFIFSTWKRQLYLSNADTYRIMNEETYYSLINDLLRNIVLSSRMCCVVPEESQRQILGWLCYNDEHNSIVFPYVKTIYRENGLMKKMIEDSFDGMPKYFSMLTGNKHFKNYTKKKNIEYLPVEFLL